MQAVNVLKNVGLAVGDEDNVELIQWLVHKAHIVLFDSGVLGTGIREFGERCEEGLNSGASNLPELARKDGLSSTSAYRGCENDLCVAWASQLWALPEPRERESKIEVTDHGYRSANKGPSKQRRVEGGLEEQFTRGAPVW